MKTDKLFHSAMLGLLLAELLEARRITQKQHDALCALAYNGLWGPKPPNLRHAIRWTLSPRKIQKAWRSAAHE